MDTLTAAQQKAIDISSTVATMKKPSDIIQSVDELLEILTGEKVFTNVPHFQPKAAPPPTTTTVVLLLFEKTQISLTLHRICKETNLDAETAQAAINQLVAQDKIKPLKTIGRKQYVRVIDYTRL